MDVYVECKLDREGGTLTFTQSVLLQSFHDEFDLPEELNKPKIPAEAGQILMKPKDGEEVASKKEQSKFQTGVGKLLHMMRWSRPDILNPTRELSKHLTKLTAVNMKALYHLMTYCLATKK